MMAESMIERVARALFEADYPNPGEVEEGSWETGRDSYMQSARAAIEAMREPTEEMVDAGQMPTYIWIDESSDDVWNRMIDAALKEQP